MSGAHKLKLGEITAVTLSVSIGRESGIPSRRTIKAWGSHSEHFVYHADFNADIFVLTHIKSGCSIARCRDFQGIRAMSAALGALPIDWDNMKQNDTLYRLNIPSEIMRWIGAINED